MQMDTVIPISVTDQTESLSVSQLDEQLGSADTETALAAASEIMFRIATIRSTAAQGALSADMAEGVPQLLALEERASSLLPRFSQAELDRRIFAAAGEAIGTAQEEK